MRDTFEREITYLRISLTDLCNLRCTYCMPPEGVKKREHREILSLEEIEEIAREAAALGVRKIRLTGGEPLVRRGMTALCRKLRAIPELEELTVTTNGILLPGLAAELKAAGAVSLIRPLSRCFCARCNRIRLTADGRLKPCLHSREEIPVRGFHGEALRRQLEKAILHKPEQHGALSARFRSETGRNMNQIGG